MKFSGPRPACRALDSLMDEIGDPIIEAINEMEIHEEVRSQLIKKVEESILNAFAPGESTGAHLRDYIYELNR